MNTGTSLPQDDETISPEDTDIPVSEETAASQYTTAVSSAISDKPAPVTAAAQHEGW